MVIEFPMYSDSCVPGKKSKVCCALQGDLINMGELVHYGTNNIRTSTLGLIFKMGSGGFFGE